ncbi:MAG: hypothetical protein R6U21_04300 [Thermoplasmatota archaeon]
MTRKQKKYIKNIIQGKWWYEHQGKESSESILFFIAHICQRLPQSIQKPFINTIDKTGLILSRLLNIFSWFSYHTFLIQGREKKSGKKISIRFRGDIDSIQFLLDFLNIEKNSTRIIENKTKKRDLNSAQLMNEHDLELHQSDSFFRKYFQQKGFLVFPEHISMILDVSKPVDRIIQQVSSSITEDLKKAEKKDYKVEVTDDYQKFVLFYERMYVPYVSWKHGSKKRIATFASIKHLWLQGAKIVLIKEKKEYIFGGIFLKENEKIVTHYAGLAKGKFYHLQHGIMAWSYYHLIVIAKKMNCSFIDFGTAHPFLSDGLLRYKAKWRMSIQKTSPFVSDIFSLKIHKKSEPLMSVFLNNPFLFFDKNKISAVFITTYKKNNEEKQYMGNNYRMVKNIPSQFFTIDELYNSRKK